MNIKLSREQELRLIQLGLDHLLNAEYPISIVTKVRPNKATKKKWSDSQRAKFQKTMKKIWAEKKASK